jgi:hypothetical protein
LLPFARAKKVANNCPTINKPQARISGLEWRVPLLSNRNKHLKSRSLQCVGLTIWTVAMKSLKITYKFAGLYGRRCGHYGCSFS